jgi:hypothetical protein
MQPTIEKTKPETTNPSSELLTSMSNLNEAFEPGSSTPPPTPPVQSLPIKQPKNPKKKLFILLLAVLLLAVGGAAAMVLTKNNKQTPSASSKPPAPTTSSAVKTPHLFITDHKNMKVALADSTGKQIYSTSVSAGMNFEASSPGKQIFMSSYDNNTQKTTFSLLDKEGKLVPINQAVQQVLGKKAYLNRSFVMLEDNDALEAVCEAQSTGKDNDCKILQLNLVSGDQKTLLETNVSSPFTTGESVFNFVGSSADHKLAYIQIVGPTKLSPNDQAVYSFDPTTSQINPVYVLPKERSVENLSISPDDKKLIYSTQTNNASASTIYTANIATKKENSISWDKNISGGALPFVWTQDNAKVSVIGFKQITGQVSSIGPLTLAYIDFDQNKMTTLQTIEDSAHQDIERLYWQDNSTLLYDTSVSSSYHDFTNSIDQIYTQSLSANTGTKVSAPSGRLDMVIYW